MDVTSDLAAIAVRIAQITGQPPAMLSAVLPGQTVDPGSFASFVDAALGDEVDTAAQVPSVTSEAAMVPPARIESLVAANSAAWGVDPALVNAIVANESGFDANATSRTGAQGLMQLEPGTAKDLGVSDAYDPAQSIWGGTRYIRGLLDRFHGDVRLAVAAYNAGPGAVEKYGGVPPYAETQNYVERVLASVQKYKVREQPGFRRRPLLHAVDGAGSAFASACRRAGACGAQSGARGVSEP